MRDIYQVWTKRWILMRSQFWRVRVIIMARATQNYKLSKITGFTVRRIVGLELTPTNNIVISHSTGKWGVQPSDPKILLAFCSAFRQSLPFAGSTRILFLPVWSSLSQEIWQIGPVLLLNQPLCIAPALQQLSIDPSTAQYDCNPFY